MRSHVFGFVSVAALLSAGSARAQLPSIDARTFRPTTDPAASLSLEPVAVTPPASFGAATYLHYSYRPVTLRRADTNDVASRPLEHVFGGDFVFSYGIKGGALGVALPYVFAQTGDKGLPSSASSVDRAPLAAIGDLALEAKAPFVTYETAGFGLGMRGRVTLPTGERTSFIGSGTTSVELRLLAEYSLLIITAHASIGYVSRFDRQQWPADSGPRIGDEIPWAFGFRVRPKVIGLDDEDRQTWELAVRGSLPAGPVGPFGLGEAGSAQLSPVLLGLSDRFALGHTKDLAVIAGADVGLDGALGVPAFRFIAGAQWTPREHDMDHDGVPDDVDQCPEIPEDRDGFEDDDGCPEIDNDDDGVLDKEDACPNQPGVEQPGPRNGCPAADSDKDGVADPDDACPNVPGPANKDRRLAGCPVSDKDGDGIPDAVDKCPNEAEDKDGFLDDDGCPDPDNDGDGVLDRVDACINDRGEPSSDPTKNGCPVHDRDGDTFEDGVDQCPDQPETFNGIKDDDGCPDEGGAPLARFDTPKGGKTTLRLARPIKLGGTPEAPAVDATSVPTLRAIALELSRHRDVTLTVGARPASAKEADVAAAQARALAVVKAVRELARREGVADVVAWDAVKAEPTAASGIGFGVVTAPAPPAAPPAKP